jgi:hypothetical protein
VGQPGLERLFNELYISNKKIGKSKKRIKIRVKCWTVRIIAPEYCIDEKS